MVREAVRRQDCDRESHLLDVHLAGREDPLHEDNDDLLQHHDQTRPGDQPSKRVGEGLKTDHHAPHEAVVDHAHDGKHQESREYNEEELRRAKEEIEIAKKKSDALEEELRRAKTAMKKTIESNSPIIPLISGSEQDTLALSSYLMDEGIFCPRA